MDGVKIWTRDLGMKRKGKDGETGREIPKMGYGVGQ